MSPTPHNFVVNYFAFSEKETMEQTSGRLAWVDYAKGLGIIGVFALHSNAPTVLLHVIDMFCMPLFFLLSGFVFSIRKYDSFPPFLWNKLRTLVFPGIFFGVIQSAVRYFTCVMVYGIRPTLTYTEWLTSFVINSRTVWLGEIPWFLACLFVIEIGGYALLRLSEHTPLRLAAGRIGPCLHSGRLWIQQVCPRFPALEHGYRDTNVRPLHTWLRTAPTLQDAGTYGTALDHRPCDAATGCHSATEYPWSTSRGVSESIRKHRLLAYWHERGNLGGYRTLHCFSAVSRQ